MPTAHEAAETTCCHVSARGAAVSASAAIPTAAARDDIGLNARAVAMGPTLAAVELVMRHAASTVGRHRNTGDAATPAAATAATPDNTGSQKACALRYPSVFTALRA